MTSVNLLSESIGSLWWWTYSIVAGWGASFTIIIAVVIILFIRTIRLNRRITQLETRLIHAERDYNITVNSLKSK